MLDTKRFESKKQKTQKTKSKTEKVNNRAHRFALLLFVV